MKTVIATVAASAFLLAAGLAAAQSEKVTATRDGARQTVVEVSDLNLSSPTGRLVLEGRVRAAAALVCGPTPTTPVNLREVTDYRTCVRDAVETALSRMDLREASADPRTRQ